MENSQIYSIKIGGQAGQGVKSAGLMLSKFAARSGFNIFNYTEYPSLIRGGHNVMQINLSAEEVSAPSKRDDLLVALNQETADKHLPELTEAAEILFDQDSGFDTGKVSSQIRLFAVPLSRLADEAGGNDLLVNSVALGAVVALWDGDLGILHDLLAAEYADKGQQLMDENKKAAQLGYDFIKENFADKLKQVFRVGEKGATKMVLNGNDAVALGAIAAGLQFAAIYPMSPASGILHTLALHQEQLGYVYKQPEDEISAINMAIGASFAGARSMTSTSGGGFSLMVEGYGLAGMTETPLVIVDGMRPGPATGLATWSGQGDLLFALRAHQGDFPRIVLAAGDVKEAFDLTMEAFNMADRYQTPVVLLIDKNICEDEQSYPLFDVSPYSIERGKLTFSTQDNYHRYSSSEDGISLRAVPGSGNFFIANSYAHTEEGFTTEEGNVTQEQMKKIMAKLETCRRESMKAPQLFGPPEADLTFVSWGSNKGSIQQAIKKYPNVNFLHLIWMNPFPAEAVKEALEKARYVVDVECNFSGQLAALIREKTGIDILDKMLKYDGRPFYPEEIEDKIREVMKQ